MLLKIIGTSESYRGLYQSANDSHPLDKALLDEMQAEFPAVAQLPAMAEAMVDMEHVHDHWSIPGWPCRRRASHE